MPSAVHVVLLIVIAYGRVCLSSSRGEARRTCGTIRTGATLRSIYTEAVSALILLSHTSAFLLCSEPLLSAVTPIRLFSLRLKLRSTLSQNKGLPTAAAPVNPDNPILQKRKNALHHWRNCNLAHKQAVQRQCALRMLILTCKVGLQASTSTLVRAVNVSLASPCEPPPSGTATTETGAAAESGLRRDPSAACAGVSGWCA
eukprot:364610-Chlamydomonas_euryale.AAC.4